MSEYWKSTPKYWCKHCKIYVKDTNFEKNNHEASGRHQGNIKRFLKDLQRGMDNKEKEKERGKRELERVTNIVEGKKGAGSGPGGTSSSSMALPPRPQATPSERKQQLAQLAEMGVNIPSELRGDLAMVGDWEVVNEKVIVEGVKDSVGLAMGVRKRETGEGEEEDEEERVAKRGRWISSIKTYPGASDDGLDELLNMATSKCKGVSQPLDVKSDPTIDVTLPKSEKAGIRKVEYSKNEVFIKGESPEAVLDPTTTVSEVGIASRDIKIETDASSTGGIVFKKRKPKNVRQK